MSLQSERNELEIENRRAIGKGRGKVQTTSGSAVKSTTT